MTLSISTLYTDNRGPERKTDLRCQHSRLRGERQGREDSKSPDPFCAKYSLATPSHRLLARLIAFLVGCGVGSGGKE